MKELLLATFNQNKCAEVRRIFQEKCLSLRLLSLANLKINEQAKEDGSNFEQNASSKALFYARFYQGYVLAEDSGLEVEALNGAPGIFSARYSGENASSQENISLLLSNLQGIKNRRARFVCCFALAKENRLIKSFCDQVEGEITFSPLGENGFGYDPIFYYPPLKKTFGQMTPQEKDSLSHRRKALEKVINYLLEEDCLWI